MHACHIEKQAISLRKCPKPKPVKGESLIRVLASGICNTDIELQRGYMCFSGIPGHEFVGIVEKSDNKELVGKRVVGEINAGCGKCGYCENDMERHCPNRTVLGMLNRPGSLAEYLCLPTQNLLVVPDSVSTDKALFTEPLAAALELWEQLFIRPDTAVCVIGDGKLGLLLAWTTALLSRNVTLLGHHQEKLALGEKYGAKGVTEIPKGIQFELVIEASGSQSGFEEALKITRPRGTIALKSTYADNTNLNFAPLVINEITLVGSRCGRFAPAMKLLENGQIDPTELIQARYPLKEVEKAFKEASQKGALKIIVECEAE